LTLMLVTSCYLLPVLAVSKLGVPVAMFATGAWAGVTTYTMGRLVGYLVVFGGLLSSLGMFNALILSYSRLPVALAGDGLLPRLLARRDAKTGAPYVAIVACGLLYSLCLRLGFARLAELDVLIYGLSLVIEFAALLALRIREPELPRPFRIPFGTRGIAPL